MTTTPQAGPESRLGNGPSLRARLAQPVDIASIVVFRIMFGGVMLWEVLRYLAYGWVRAYYIEPPFHFTYWGIEWVRPLPGDWMYAVFSALGALSVAVMCGAAYRLSIVLFTCGFTYWFLLEQTRYQNHFYLIGLLSLILCCVPAGAACSIDARTNPQRRRATVPVWMLWLLRFQLATPFVFGAVAKVTPDWLRGEPMRMWLADQTDFPLIGTYFTQEWVVYVFAWGGLVFDLLIVPLLLWPKTRFWAYGLNVLFHLMNSQLFHIGIFPWFLIGATTIFLDPAWPRRVVAVRSRVCGWLSTVEADVVREPVTPFTQPLPVIPIGKLTAVFLGLYVTVQCLIPLWHYRYPGPSSWTMEGHYFAWHMRIAEKVSGVRFYVTDPTTGIREAHDPNSVLPRWQVDAMSVNPELIRKDSHYLAQLRARADRPPVEVRARVLNSLNGRVPQLLVKPDVNLAAVPFSWDPADWIVPLRDPRPGSWRPKASGQTAGQAVASGATDRRAGSDN